MRSAALLTLFSASLLPANVSAITVRLCIKTNVDYVDAGFGEDFWTTSGPTSQLARGALLHVYNGNNRIFANYLGDSIGAGDPGTACTSDLVVATPATLDLYLFSYGVVQSNNVTVTDASGAIRSAIGSTDITSTTTSPRTVTISTTGNSATFRVFNVYQAAAYALYRHAGGMIEDYSFEAGDPTPCQSGQSSSCNQDGIVYISTGGSDNKFLIVHELGHRIGNLGTGNNFSSARDDCDLTEDEQSGCPSYPSSHSHSMRSGEYVGCALDEGFAHFYAADVWNSHAEADCRPSIIKQSPRAFRTQQSTARTARPVFRFGTWRPRGATATTPICLDAVPSLIGCGCSGTFTQRVAVADSTRPSRRC